MLNIKSQITYGRCSCGDIKYEFASPVKWVEHCHCTDCRRQCGSVIATFISLKKYDFKLSKGTPKSFQSSPGIIRTFCRNCGTPMTYESKSLPNEIHIYLGTLDEPEKFPAQFHFFTNEHVAWFSINDETTRFETLPPSVTKN